MDKVYVPLRYDLSIDEYVLEETSETDGSLDELVRDILTGFCPNKVVEVDVPEHDVSKMVAQEVVARAWDLGVELTSEVADFVKAQGVMIPPDVRVRDVD